MPLSAKQMEYLALAWQCFDTEPKIDYAKFAAVAGLASPHSARELMRVTKNKLKDEYGALSSGLQGSNAGPRTPGKKGGTPGGTPGSRKRVRKEAGEGQEEEGTPVGKKTKTKGSANGGEGGAKKTSKVVKTEPVEGSEGEEASFF